MKTRNCEIAVGMIKQNDFNKIVYDYKSKDFVNQLFDLKKNISQVTHGKLLIPLTVYGSKEKGYTLISGHRRLQAVKELYGKDYMVECNVVNAPKSPVAMQSLILSFNVDRVKSKFEIAREYMNWKRIMEVTAKANLSKAGKGEEVLQTEKGRASEKAAEKVGNVGWQTMDASTGTLQKIDEITDAVQRTGMYDVWEDSHKIAKLLLDKNLQKKITPELVEDLNDPKTRKTAIAQLLSKSRKSLTGEVWFESELKKLRNKVQELYDAFTAFEIGRNKRVKTMGKVSKEYFDSILVHMISTMDLSGFTFSLDEGYKEDFSMAKPGYTLESIAKEEAKIQAKKDSEIAKVEAKKTAKAEKAGIKKLAEIAKKTAMKEIKKEKKLKKQQEKLELETVSQTTK
jgi:hypothetical protein